MAPVTRAPAVRPRSGRTRTRTLLAAGCALMLALGVAGCGDDDDASDGAASGGEDDRGAPSASEGPADPISLDDLAATSGGAPAATGADLDEAPGPADRTGLTGDRKSVV